MPLPHFIGIGAHKAGSSWLAEQLKMHPDVYVPPTKEIHYFSRSKIYPSPNLPDNRLMRIFFDKGSVPRWWRIFIKEVLRNKNQDEQEKKYFYKYLFGAYNDQWYSSLFDLGKDKIRGEVTPAYSILDRNGVEKVHALTPKAKIIFILRDPIQRMWSSFRDIYGKKKLFHHLDKKIIFKRKRPPDEAIILHLEHRAQVLRGDYLRTIKIWRRFFPEDQIFIGFFDEIVGDPGSFIEKIYDFLELKEPGKYSSKLRREKVNVSKPMEIPRNILLYLANAYHEQVKELNDMFGGCTSSWLKNIEEIKGRNDGKQ